MGKSEEYSINDLNDLIRRIQEATSLNENDIEREISRSYGYLAQTRSRGKVPVALYKLLQNTFKDSLQNTRPANGYKNGNGPTINNGGPPMDELIKAKDETIGALHRHINFLEQENQRLKRECEISLTGLNRYAQIVSARVQTILESQKLIRAVALQSKVDQKKMDVASQELDKIYSAILQDTIQSDKD